MTEEQIIEKIIDRAMTSGAVIGPEFINDHSHAWETDRKIYSDEIMSLIKQAQYEYGLELMDNVKTGLRTYRARFPDATYDDAIGVLMGFGTSLRQRNEEKRV